MLKCQLSTFARSDEPSVIMLSCRNSCVRFTILFIFQKKEVEENHKPSSVVPTPLFSGSQEDGHLSRALIAQGLKRPNPPRFSPARGGGKFEWALLSLAETGPIWSCSGWGLPGYSDHSEYGELLPRLFTLIPASVGTVSFLWHFPYPETYAARVSRQSVLRTTLPCGARTFLPS